MLTHRITRLCVLVPENIRLPQPQKAERSGVDGSTRLPEMWEPAIIKQRKVFLITERRQKNLIIKWCVWHLMRISSLGGHHRVSGLLEMTRSVIRNSCSAAWRRVLTFQGGSWLKVVSKSTSLGDVAPMNGTFMPQNLNRYILMQ